MCPFQPPAKVRTSRSRQRFGKPKRSYKLGLLSLTWRAPVQRHRLWRTFAYWESNFTILEIAQPTVMDFSRVPLTVVGDRVEQLFEVTVQKAKRLPQYAGVRSAGQGSAATAGF